MNGDAYDEMTSRLSAQLGEFADARRELLLSWQDSASMQAAPLMATLVERVETVSQSIGLQSEAHQRAAACCRLLDDHVTATGRLVGESQASLVEASSAHRDAQRAASEAVAAARASAESLDEALRLLGRSGAVSSAEWAARVQRAVARDRRRTVWGMVGKAVAVEGAWVVGEQIVQQVGSIPDGALPGNWNDQLSESLTGSVPVAAAQISTFVQSLVRKWSGS